MPPIEEYLKRADELAEQVMTEWGKHTEAGNATLLSDEFKAVIEKAWHYRGDKEIADNHREFSVPSEREAAEEIASRQAFAEAYKAYFEKYFLAPSTQKQSTAEGAR